MDSSSVLGTDRDQVAESANQPAKSSVPAIIVRSSEPIEDLGRNATTTAVRSQVANAAQAHAAGKKPPLCPARSATSRKPNSQTATGSIQSEGANDREWAWNVATVGSIGLSQ